jgi:serine/threonine protein kinase/tetratricopeptide (TPR) repeat protein
MIGEAVAHYRILEKLGSGGMGVVYKATDTKLHRYVALKFLPEKLAHSRDALDRFQREARAAAALEHPSICAIYDVSEHNGQPYIVMQFLQGQTLRDRIAGKPLPIVDVLDIGIQVARGLQIAHAAGIIHRDIKPSNIFVTKDGQTKILDFGVAKRASGAVDISEKSTLYADITGGSIVGTVSYMSPEQIRGEDLDGRSDLFSLGLVLYEMVTGQEAFAGNTTGVVFDKILNRTPKEMPALNPEVPSELEAIVNRALQKDRRLRHDSASALADDLVDFRESFCTRPAVKWWARQFRASLPSRRIIRRWIFAVAVFVIALVSVMLWRMESRPVLPFAARDWIVLTDVENQTGDPLFDKSLDTAFSVSLEQSRYANVYPRSRIDQALKRMKRSGAGKFDAPVAQELALREGLRAVIIPSITSIGDTYSLAFRIRDPATGENVRTESVRVQGKDKVLGAVDELAIRVRRNIGEALSAISQTNKPLVAVTTSSLEALQQFSIGNQKSREANVAEAKTYYENALRIDPSFTAAKAILGMINFENFDTEIGKKLLAEAVQNANGLTDKEKFNILAFQARAVENDLTKAAEYTKLMTDLYPDVSGGFNNLGWYYYQMGRDADSIAAYKQALRLDPYLMLSYDILNLIYLNHTGDLSAALALCREQIARNDNHAEAYDNMGWAYLGQGDLNLAVEMFKKALELDPKLSLVRFRLGHIYRIQRRYPEAADILLSILKIDPSAFRIYDDPPYSAYYDAGVAYQDWGNTQLARQNFESFMSEVQRRLKAEPNDPMHHFDLALVLGRLGRHEQSLNVANNALKIAPAKYFEFARVLSINGRRQEALDSLEKAVKEGFRNYIWLRIHPDFENLYDEPRYRNLIENNLKK